MAKIFASRNTAVLGFLSSIFSFIINGTDGRKERWTRARVAENDVPFDSSAWH